MPCNVPGCTANVWAKGLCKFHDGRKRAGTPLDKPRNFKQLEKTGWVHKGYRWISTEAGEVMEHRYLMELHLGRRLGLDEIVHHKNGDKLDNRLANLEVMSRAEHTAQHRTRNLGCLWCGLYDPHGSYGLCAKHKLRVLKFLKSAQLGNLPTDRTEKALLLMGVGLVLADHDGEVVARVNALRLDEKVHTRYARQRNRSRSISGDVDRRSQWRN